MKKILTMILILALLVSALSITAAAASYENSADDLYSLGLLLGTGDGYDLESVPTRAQASVMLVRLLGQEKEALAGEYEHPFTDVPVWAEKYVAYLYENGLTNGISAELFGTDVDCDVKMFVTFVLRILGYEGDFEYDNALIFGAEIGVVDIFLAESEFTRGEMVAISLLALKMQPKDGSYNTLLDKLVADGAVTAEAAKPILERFAAYDEMFSAISNYNDVKKMDVDMKITSVMSMLGDEFPVNYDMRMKMSLENSDLQMAVTGGVEMFGEEIPLEYYFKDGYYYMNAAGQKVKMPMDMDEALAETGYSGVNEEPFYTIANIVKTTDGANSIFEVEYSAGAMNKIIDTIMAGAAFGDLGIGDVNMSTKINDITIKYVVDGNGKLAGYIIDMDMDMVMTMEGETIDVGFLCTMVMNIVATGDSVTVTFPDDLNAYVEITE